MIPEDDLAADIVFVELKSNGTVRMVLWSERDGLSRQVAKPAVIPRLAALRLYRRLAYLLEGVPDATIQEAGPPSQTLQ